jgi:hypothetical protein
VVGVDLVLDGDVRLSAAAVLGGEVQTVADAGALC